MCAGEIPTLRFDDRITWKQIFDFGFRPKHVEGLEDHKCISHDQSFFLEFKDSESKFKLDSGRVQFGFFYDDFLQMVWHQGGEPLTLEEGMKRAAEFRSVFDGYVIQEITMPRHIDPNGLVDAGNDENNVKVRVGEYLIWYGFDNSLGKVKPIIPHFYITWNFPGRPDVRLKDARDVVRPPKGYEWYSLDPKVNTPDPETTPLEVEEPMPSVTASEEKTPSRADDVSQPPAISGTNSMDIRWGWWSGLAGIFLVVAVATIKRFSK